MVIINRRPRPTFDAVAILVSVVIHNFGCARLDSRIIVIAVGATIGLGVVTEVLRLRIEGHFTTELPADRVRVLLFAGASVVNASNPDIEPFEKVMIWA